MEKTMCIQKDEGGKGLFMAQWMWNEKTVSAILQIQKETMMKTINKGKNKATFILDCNWTLQILWIQYYFNSKTPIPRVTTYFK